MRDVVDRARAQSTAIAAVALLIAAMLFGFASIQTSHVAGGQDEDAEVVAQVRVSAQRLENGAVRFGLRVRDERGIWAEPVTPRAHWLIPSNVSTGRWLASSPLTLDVNSSGRGRLLRSDRFESPSTGNVLLATGLEEWMGDTHLSAYHDEEGDLLTRAAIYSVSPRAPDGELRTVITCRNGELSVDIGGLPSQTDIGSGVREGQQLLVSWNVDDGARQSERRAVASLESGLELIQGAQNRLAEALLGDGSQLTLSIGAAPRLNAAINLAALRSLPVYDNLRYCSAEPERTGHNELRIRAQVRDDQRIEFAVQQRTADGWSDNILPRARVMPAFGDATNWLSSTPVRVSVELNPAREVVMPYPALRRAVEPITPSIRSGPYSASLSYEVDELELEDYWPPRLNSTVTVGPEEGLRLHMGCFGDERRVLLHNPTSDATGDLALSFDDTQLTARWNVSIQNGVATLAPADHERTIRRLRQADTLSVTLGTGDSDPTSFDISNLFEMPIQRNIDHCGNYTEPDWQPVRETQNVLTETGIAYRVNYPEWTGYQRNSHVSVPTIGDPSTLEQMPLSFSMTCNSRWLTFQIHGLSEVGNPASVRIRADSGDWLEETVNIYDVADGTVTAAFSTDLQRIRQGATLDFELGLEEPVRGSFDLSKLFDTPIQANFDNCATAYWTTPKAYVPITELTGDASHNIQYLAIQNEDGSVSTVVTADSTKHSEFEEPLRLQLQCRSFFHVTAFVAGPLVAESGDINVTMTIDNRPSEMSLWYIQESYSRGLLYPPSVPNLMAQIREASVVVLEIPELSAEPFVFHVSGMFDTPLQDNIDECGYYAPGRSRMLEPRNVHDSHQMDDADKGLSIWRFWQRTPGGANIPYVNLLESQLRGDYIEIGVLLSCGSGGAELFIYGTSTSTLPEVHVLVTWSTDGGARQWATWNVVEALGGKVIHPLRARPLIASWRQASELEFTLLGDSPTTHHFDLEALFDFPATHTLDDCLAAQLPAQSLPVWDVPVSRGDHLSYSVGPLGGSAWTISRVDLLDNGEATVEGRNSDPRSTVSFDCGAGGIELAIIGLDRAEATTIDVATVDVTWNIDGLWQSDTWDAWTESFNYTISPPDDMAFYEALRGAETLTVHVLSDPPITKTYELGRHDFWDTPVQPNLDACSGQ